MRELTYQDLEDKGINTSMIAVCKKLRQLAKLDRVKLDESEHRSGLNKHLFDYIDYCGMDILTFIKEYLSNIQPYMIERRKDQEKENTFICVIDNLYRISIYIKVDNKQFEELIISFHEDNKRGVAKVNNLIKLDSQKYVPIFADSILSKVSGENKFIVRAIFQRGMKILPLELPAIQCKDIFIVEKNAINMQFISYCNDYIRDLYTSDLNLDFDSIEVFSILQQISFTSYGRDTFSSISLLIDSVCIQPDAISRSTADFALITFIQNLKLTSEQANELVYLLEEKFRVTSIKKIDIILDRVKESLKIAVNNSKAIQETDLDSYARNAQKLFNELKDKNFLN